MTAEELVTEILDRACGMMMPEEVKENQGFQRYYIETHCTDLVVEAKKVEGKWEIRSCQENH